MAKKDKEKTPAILMQLGMPHSYETIKEIKEKKTSTTGKTSSTSKKSSSGGTSSTGKTKSTSETPIIDAAFRLSAKDKESRASYSSAPKPTKKYTDYNTETKNAYSSSKNKATYKITITSNLTEKERKARIKEVETELRNLNYTIEGYGRAASYSGQAYQEQLASKREEAQKRKEELSKELKTLKRVGTFTASELKQFEIDDAKARKAALPSYNPTARVMPSEAESHKKNIMAHAELDKEIDRLEREKAEYKRIEKLDELNAHTTKITSKQDFEQNSKYSPIKPKTAEELKAEGYKQNTVGQWYKTRGMVMDIYTGEDSDLYTYINDPSKRLSLEVDGPMVSRINTYELNGYHTLFDEEKGAFNYLYHQDRNNGTNTAEEYLRKIGPLLQQRAMELEAKTYAEISKEAPVLMSGISLGTNFANGLMFPAKAVATATGIYEDMPMLDMYGNRTQAIRGGVSEDMPYWGSLLYNAGMSIGDMGVAMLAGGGNAKIVQAIMSSSAGSSTISEAKKNGASDGKALVLGLGSAAIEWATEKYSVEAILKEPKTIKGFILANTFTEATEEGASNISNTVLDAIISEVFDERNEIEQRIDYLVLYEGMAEEEALTIAFNEKLQSLGEDVLVGGITGFGMSGAKVSAIGVNNAITNRGIIDTYIEDEETLDALIEEGKYYGEGSRPFNLAEEVEKAKENGELKRSQIKKLIKANDKAESASTPDTLEQAARDVVESRNKKSGIALLEARKRGEVTPQMLETLTQHNVPITNAEAKKATGFGDRGAELVANNANVEGATFSQTLAEVEPSYLAGFNHPDLDIKKVAHTFDTQAQEDAYTAGQIDRKMQDLQAEARAKNATVYDGVFTENEFTKNFSKAEKTMISTVAKSLAMDSSIVDKIIASEMMVNGKKIEFEANAQHQDGEMQISSTAEKAIYKLVMHEGGHRMRQLAPQEFGMLMNALYERAERRATNSGMAQSTAFDYVRDEHLNAGITKDTSGYIEEIAVRELEEIFGSARAFNKWYAEISGNQQLKTNFEKFIDWVLDVIDDIKRALKQANMTKAERAEANAELDRIKELYTNAYKAAENAVAERRESQRQKAQNNTNIEGSVSYSLSPTKRKRLEQTILDISNANIKKVAGNKEIKISTDQFSVNKAIYSKKGRTAREVNARIKAIPEFETIIRQSTFSYTDTDIIGLDSAAKKDVIAMHYFETVYNGYDIEIVVRDKGKKQFLYEVKFIENKKSSQQSMSTDADSSAPKGDVENDLKIPQNSQSVKNDFSLKDSQGNAYKAEENVDIDSGVNFSLKNKNLTINSRIPYVELNNYINVAKNDYSALNKLVSKVKNLKRGTYQNYATGYRADINSDTIRKAVHPTHNKFNAFKETHIRNLNAIVKLPELFENAVYVDSKNPQKTKNQTKAIKEYHHFVAPIFMDKGEYRALITAREKVNSNTLYVLKVEVLPTQKRHTLSTTQQNAGGSQWLSVPSDVSISELINGVKIKNYDTNTEDTYTGADIQFSIKDNAYKTAENYNTNSAKNLEIKTNEEYNGNTSHSLKDSTNESNNIATIKKLIRSIQGKRGLKYDGGRVIRIPNNDMATLRHKFMTEHHYSNRSGGIIDCIDCFGQGGNKHYFYVFYVGEDNRVAPIFRLDYQYIERYVDDIQKISNEMGYKKDEFIVTASGNGKGIDRIRNLAKSDSVYDVSVTREGSNHQGGEGYNNEGRERTTDNRRNDSGLSNGYNERSNNGGIKEEYNENINYSLKNGTAESEQYGVMWTLEEGVLTNREVSAFYEKVSEAVSSNYKNYRISQDGDYIFEVGNKLIYSDGDYDSPTIYSVITFDTNNETVLGDARRFIYDAEESGAGQDSAFEIIEIVYGETFTRTASYEDSRVYERENGTGEGSDSETVNQGSRTDVSYSLKWHTDLSKNDLIELMDEIKYDIRSSKNAITDEANWLFTDIGGKDVFAIYSTDDYKDPTLLYESKGKKAEQERNILLNVLEETKNGVGVDRQSATINEVSGGSWMQKVNGVKNSIGGMYTRNGSSGNVAVLQGKSSTYGSPAFRNVIKNLVEISSRGQRGRGVRDGELSETKSYSLKNGSNPNAKIQYSPTGIKLPESQKGKDFSLNFADKTIKSFGIKNIADYIHVQRQVLDTLVKENFFTDNEKRRRIDINKDSDMVIETNKSGIDETFSFNNFKRLGKHKKILKLATIRLLPEVIREGKLLEDDVKNKYNDGINKTFAYIEHEVNVDNKNVVVKLAIKKSPQKNKFWVHSIYTIENVSNSPASTINGTEAGHITADTTKTISHLEQNVKEFSDHSLKGGMSATELFDTVDDARKGKRKAIDKLSRYVDSGALSTEFYNELIEKYGAIPSGEKPHRDIQVPRKTGKNKKVSQTVRTILEATATPDEAVPTIEKMVEDGIFSYDVYTDKQAINDAEAYIKEYGWDESLDDWFDAVDKGEVSKQITAMGWALYNNAANIAVTTTSETERTTAIKTSLKILDAMVKHQRSAAQALQATRILKSLSPETQLYGVQKSVSALQNELSEKYGDKAPDLQIDAELAKQFITAETAEERAEIEKEIYKDIGRQMPSRFIDKWNAWRYLAMLGNPRTHIRNIVGNAGFAPVVAAKDLTATAIESIVNRVSTKKIVRGKALVTGSKADRTLLKAAWGDYGNVAELISNGGKYNDRAMANQHIEEGRQIFNVKPLEWARKKNSTLLEVEDMWFAQPHYAYALAQYCKANNITAEQIKKGKAIAPAREYAIKEAQKATYRDTNAFSQLVSEWGRSNQSEKNVVKKAFSTVVEGILPFRKTPANILVRGVEYSPLGLIKGLSYDLYKVSKGDLSASEAIDNISAGLTGTGLLALGVFLAAQGLVRGHGGDDKEEKEFEKLMGHQSYALELPDGQSITLDWLAPEALPFFVGVNLWEATNGSDEEANLSTILQAVSNISEPMLEMSCLQGLNDLFEGIGYASSNDTSGLVSVISSAATSYLMQGIPTVSGQAERTGEAYRMSTYTEKDDFLTGDMQYTLGKASAKIPFWDYHQIPYIDAWGRKEASGAALKRGLNNFLNPAYTSTVETSKMEKELLRLYESTGEDGVFPSRADKYFTVDGVRKDLTADEYVKYATLKGQKSYKLVSDLVKSKAYKALDDEEKVKAIDEAYDYANQKAKQAISNYKPETWVGKADEFGANVGSYISFKANVNGTKENNGGKISKQEVVDIILDMAQNDSDTWKMYLSMYDSTSDMYAYNKGIGGETYMYFLESLNDVDMPTKSGKYGTYTQAEATSAIKRLDGLSRQEKAALWQSVNTTWKRNPFR